MFSSSFNKYGTKKKVKKLINKGLFDDNISEINKALNAKRTFTKDIKFFFIDKINTNLDNSVIKNLKQTYNHNSIIKKSLTKKNFFHGINFYEFNKYKEEEFNKEMEDLLKALNFSQNEAYNKFKILKEENDMFHSLYIHYKKIKEKNNKNLDDENIFMMLYDLLIKYKSDKNLSINIGSLYSDIIKDSPLTQKDIEKLKFYYIINGEKLETNNKKDIVDKKNDEKNLIFNMNKFYNSEKSFHKIKTPKEPKVFDLNNIENLKEIKYLSKINITTKNKIIYGGQGYGNPKSLLFKKKTFCIGKNQDNSIEDNNKNEELNNDEIEDEDEYNLYKFKDYSYIKEKKMKNLEKNKKRLEIEKDIKEINKLKKSIKNSFTPKLDKKISLKSNLSNFKAKKLSIGAQTINNFYSNEVSYDQNKNTIFSNEHENENAPNIKGLNNKPRKSNLCSRLRIINNKDIFYRVKSNSIQNQTIFSNKNIYQGSTFYSNFSNNLNMNNSNLSKNSFNLSSFNLSNNFNKTPKKKVSFVDDIKILSSKESKYNINESSISKDKIKKSKSLSCSENKEDFYDKYLSNKIEEVYSMAKSINMSNKDHNIHKINKFLKNTNSKLPLLYKGNKLKDTLNFFHKIKKELINHNIKYNYIRAKKLLNDKDRKKLKYLGNVESDLINKEKELLIKMYRNKSS